MTYNKKIAFLGSLAGALALFYILLLFFEPERSLSRSAAYTWLPQHMAGMIDRISSGEAGDPVVLVLKNNEWFVSYNGNEYPARQLRVTDFIGVLTKRAPYPVRSVNASSLERLGLGDDDASRITIGGGAGLPLLDLLVGKADSTGREVYMRVKGRNEVRSGEDFFTVYTSGGRIPWYNLKLFPETENGRLDSGSVQRVTVTDGGEETRVFTRNGRDWVVSGLEAADTDTARVEAYVRSMLTTEGDDFAVSVDSNDPLFSHSRITLELGDGGARILRCGPPDENNRRLAAVQDKRYVYSLPGWSTERLFRGASYFVKQ